MTRVINYYTYIPILISTFILSFIILRRNPKNAVNLCFGGIILSLAIWVFCLLFADTSTQQDNALLWTKLAIIGPSLMPSFFLLFSLIFTNHKLKTITKSIIFVPSLPFIFLFATSFNVKSVVVRPWGAEVNPGIMYTLLFAFFAVYILSGAIILFKQYKVVKGIKKQQIQLIVLGTLLATIFGISTNVILVSFGISQLSIMGPLAALILVSFTTRAITKHRLMDIRALVVKSVVYTILVSIVALSYIGVVYFATQSYGQLINRNVLFIITGFVLVFSFQPLRRGLEKATDNIFFKDRYNFQRLLSNIGDMFATKLGLDELTKGLMLKLTQEMRIIRSAVVLMTGRKIDQVRTLDYSRSKSFWAKIAHMVVEKDNLLITDELWEESEERQMLREHRVDVIVPLKNEEEFVGFLAVGEKRSGDMYTSEDIRLLTIIAPQTAIALQNAMLFLEKEQRIRELDALNKLALHVGSTLHLDKIMDAVLEEAIEVTDAEAGSIMLLDQETNSLVIKANKGIPRETRNRRIKVGEGIAGWVAKFEKPLNIDGQNKQFKPFIKREEITSSISVPLKVRDKLIGVLNVNRRKKRTPFTDENMHLVVSFAFQAAEAIDNANLYENLEKTFLETISALAAAVDAKDHYTYGHAEEVTKFAVAIAQEMGLSFEEVNMIKVASKLHDIGKIGINETILNKPGKLSKEERELIQEHPKIGVDILKSVESLKDVIPLILYHHERVDGDGYPTGMPGHVIPIGAKILAVADSFHAMTSDRPYRKALPLSESIAELKRCSGSQFDHEIVKVFIKLINEGRFDEKHKKKKEEKPRLKVVPHD